MADVIRFTHPETDLEVEVPAKFEICGRCEGRGKHVNSAIDGNGLSSQDFDEDPDFREDYFSGNYDVRCEECGGNRVTLEPDWDKMSPEVKKVYSEYLDGERDWAATFRAERDAERRMGA